MAGDFRHAVAVVMFFHQCLWSDGRLGRGLEKPEVPPSPFAYGGSFCISADPTETHRADHRHLHRSPFIVGTKKVTSDVGSLI